jgi:hypothetical protein
MLGGRCWASDCHGKERATIKEDIYDIPTVYLLYVLLAIVVIVAATVIAIIRML